MRPDSNRTAIVVSRSAARRDGVAFAAAMAMSAREVRHLKYGADWAQNTHAYGLPWTGPIRRHAQPQLARISACISRRLAQCGLHLFSRGDWPILL